MEIFKQPDIKPGLSREDWEKQCEHYAEDAFYTPPDQFLFKHYDEPEGQKLICHRPMAGIEKYVVNDEHGRFYGMYETRDVTYYLKSGTWIEFESEEFFRQQEIERLEHRLEQLKSK